MDCDGCEVTLLSELVPLALRVRHVHLSTHSREIHQLLLGSLKAASWHINYDFAPRSAVTSMTSVGPFLTKDGRIVAASPFQWRRRFFYGKRSCWDWLGLVMARWKLVSWWISQQTRSGCGLGRVSTLALFSNIRIYIYVYIYLVLCDLAPVDSSVDWLMLSVLFSLFGKVFGVQEEWTNTLTRHSYYTPEN